MRWEIPLGILGGKICEILFVLESFFLVVQRIGYVAIYSGAGPAAEQAPHAAGNAEKIREERWHGPHHVKNPAAGPDRGDLSEMLDEVNLRSFFFSSPRIQ